MQDQGSAASLLTGGVIAVPFIVFSRLTITPAFSWKRRHTQSELLHTACLI